MPLLVILACTKEDRLLDVIGHVEKDTVKKTEKNGKISKAVDVTLEHFESIASAFLSLSGI